MSGGHSLRQLRRPIGLTVETVSRTFTKLRLQGLTEELRLQQRVIDELEFDPAVNSAHIGVSVRGNVVTLAVHVSTYGEKFAA